MIRTLLLVASFAWFVRQSAQFGDDVLAANHILLQLISFSAFFLDAFAYVAEALVGEAAGAKDASAFDVAVLKSTQLAGLSALVLAAGIFFAGDHMVPLLSQHEAVRQAAAASVPFAALYVALAFAAFQLDGIFIGTTRTREMRNASVVSRCVWVGICQRCAGQSPLTLLLTGIKPGQFALQFHNSSNDNDRWRFDVSLFDLLRNGIQGTGHDTLSGCGALLHDGHGHLSVHAMQL
jgi:Na+-driven multidrug efflux pump